MINKAMKYAVILGDGMADLPIEELGSKTLLEYANTPTFDFLAKRSTVFSVRTTPDSMSPGSDICNLSVMGYSPEIYHTGRSPLEAASIGINIGEDETSFRCNLVCLSDDEPYDKKVMVDYSAEEITTKEAIKLIDALNEHFETKKRKFYTGISYRHILLSSEVENGQKLTPPHDISKRVVGEYLPENEIIRSMMEESYKLLSSHPINIDRIKRGLNPANSIWIWGQGKKTALPSFNEKYGVKGAVISAVDLIKGIAKCADMNVVEVEGATGNVHTNFMGKAQAMVDSFKNGYNFVYVHIEAADESGHRGELQNKIRSIEKIDEVTKYVYDYLMSTGEPFRMLITPDHPTPLSTLTHSRANVPAMIFDSRSTKVNEDAKYSERYADEKGILLENGTDIMEYLMERK